MWKMKRRWKKMQMTDINDLLEDIEREYTVTEETIITEDEDCDCEDDKGSCGGCGGGCG
jgi:hypothetical protein